MGWVCFVKPIGIAGDLQKIFAGLGFSSGDY